MSMKDLVRFGRIIGTMPAWRTCRRESRSMKTERPIGCRYAATGMLRRLVETGAWCTSGIDPSRRLRDPGGVERQGRRRDDGAQRSVLGARDGLAGVWPQPQAAALDLQDRKAGAHGIGEVEARSPLPRRRGTAAAIWGSPRRCRRRQDPDCGGGRG